MSEQSDVTQNISDSVMDSVNSMPASQTAPFSQYGPGNRFLTKDKTVHQLLGGGRGEASATLWIVPFNVAYIICTRFSCLFLPQYVNSEFVQPHVVNNF